MAPEQLFELRRRSFDTPQFRGIEFIEVEAKSIINHVPGSYLPFNWTINPYRGCTHACSYCMSGDTPILMGDGRTKALRDVRVGDRIYGTVREGAYRRYVVTTVLAHWSTVKPAFAITLEDGTRLIASGDHRFLSDRGWKHVTGSEQGRSRRPHLTLNNKLMGTGRFSTPPAHGPDYRRGYLCGIIRGDGHLGSYSYPRPGRWSNDVYRFRLALVDLDALRRARAYLRGLAVETDEFPFQQASGGWKALTAIRTSKRAGVAAIAEIVRWPEAPSDEWCKGFLAGIFDAEGCCSSGIFRISNTDHEIIGQIASCLTRFGFSFVSEETARENVMTIRLRGGSREKLRFFHTADPAIERKRSIEGIAIKSDARLGITAIEPLGVDLPLFDITTGTGDFIADGVIAHNCFARVTHTYMDMDAGKDFETKIVVKVNAPHLLPKELRAKRWKGEHIAMGTATDPYQRAEGRYGLMPRIIETLTEFRNPFSILTKGTLILRDLDLLVEAAKVCNASTAFSIATLDEDVWRNSEPGTPHPRKRIEAVARLNDAGVPCGVLVAPVLPGISDHIDQLRDVVTASMEAGATNVSPILLHLRPKVREVYMDWLAQAYPEQVERHEQMYAKSAYASSADKADLAGKVSAIVESVGAPTRRPATRRSPRSLERATAARARIEPEQLQLL